MGNARLDFLNHEPVSGQLLSERLAAGPLAAEDALRYSIELGAAIGRVHSGGLVHGAVSPECIAITSEGLKLLQPAGTLESRAPYTSPEQVRGEPADARSDIFAFGAVAYELVSGQRAFPGTGADLKRATLTLTPSSLTSTSPAGAALAGVIAGCLEKEPPRRRQRIQNAVIELRLAGRGATGAGDAPRRKATRPISAAVAACRPTAKGSTSAPTVFGIPSGRRKAWAAGTAANSAKPPASVPIPMNRTDAQCATSPRRHAAQLPQQTTGRTATEVPWRQPLALRPAATTSPHIS